MPALAQAWPSGNRLKKIAAACIIGSPALRSRLRALGLAGLLVAAIFCLSVIYVGMFYARGALNRDYIEYWAQGQRLAHHADPFNPSAILRVQQSAGVPFETALISFSPPVALWFTQPLGFVSAISRCGKSVTHAAPCLRR